MIFNTGERSCVPVMMAAMNAGTMKCISMYLTIGANMHWIT